MRTVYDIGVNDWSGKVRINGKLIPEYTLWRSMLQRCKQFKDSGVYCHGDWTSMTLFISSVGGIENYDKAINDNWQLDKDILIKGNKFYSEETCCFVPREINLLLTKRQKCRGDFPIGVVWHKPSNSIVAQLSTGESGTKYLGMFRNEVDAFNRYKIEKEKYIKIVAEKWKGIIADNVYNALMNYEVSIDD